MRITEPVIAINELKTFKEQLCVKRNTNYKRNMKHKPACPNVVAPICAPVVINLSNVPKQIVHCEK